MCTSHVRRNTELQEDERSSSVDKNTFKRTKRFHRVVRFRIIAFQFHFQLYMRCIKVIALTPETEQPTCKNIIKIH